MKVTIGGTVVIEDPQKHILADSTKKLKISNVQYYKNEKLGISNFGTNKYFYYYYWSPDNKRLEVPIGYWIENFWNITPDVDNRKDFNSDIIENCEFKGNLREYQEKAVETLIKYTNGILESPTGSGKTVIALNLIKRMKQKTIFLVHTIDLADQFIKACEKFLGYTPGLIGSGSFEIKDISVCILQTLIKLDNYKIDEINNNFGMMIGDEVHKLAADEFFRGTSSLTCKYKYGLSATPTRGDGKTKVIQFATGPIRHKITFDNVKSNLCFPRFEYVNSDYIFPIFSSREYDDLLTDLSGDKTRNNLILEQRNKYKDKKAIILCKRIIHMQVLSSVIEESKMLHSKTPSKERKEILKDFRENKFNTLISSYGILGTGIDDNEIDILILAGPTSSEIDVKQSIGRTMRPREGKEAVIIDIIDSKIGMLASMAKTRKKYYTKYIKMYEEQNAKFTT